MSDYPPRVFEARIADPDGIEVSVTVRIPPGAIWPTADGRDSTANSVAEAAEVAQVSAVQAINRIAGYKERPPF